MTPKAQEKLTEVLRSIGQPQAAVRVVAVRGPHGCVHGWRLAEVVLHCQAMHELPVSW